MGTLDSLIYLEERKKADLDKQYRAEGIDIAVIDDSGLYGTLSSALWTNEVYMKNVKDMVANVLKKKGPYKIRRLDVIDHGNVRTFQIGGDWIGLENLNKFEGELSKLTGQFTAGGFVHLQHCDIGMNRPLLAALAKLWNVSVYAGEGSHRATIRYQSGKYVRADPNGKVYYDGRPNQDTYQNYIGMWGEEAPMSGSREEVSTSFRNSSQDSYPEPNDEYLIRTLGRRYAANDVAGPAARAKELTRDFQRGVPPKSPLARTLHARLESRKKGDKLSMYFHDHLSTATRTKLLGILKNKL